MSGKFQLSREIFEHPIWQNQAEFRLFIYLIGKAMHSEGVIIGSIKLNKGQYIRSYRKLREDLMYIENNTIKHYGLGTIKRLVDKLVTDGRIEILETELGTLFTVTNYTQYQGFSQVVNGSLKQQRNTNGTPTEHQRNNNKNGNNGINDNKEDIPIVTEPYKPIFKVEEPKIYKPIIDYLNSKTDKNYRSTSNKTKDLINARTNEGFVLEDFIKVIDTKVAEWLGSDMDKFLRPETLFSNKFEGYLNQNPKAKDKTKKTGFHVENNRTDNYDNEGLENVFDRKRAEAREKLKGVN